MSDSRKFVKCRICGKRFRQIIWKHLKTHNITVVEYKQKFPKSKLISEDLSERKSNSGKGRQSWNKGLTKKDYPNMSGWSKRRKHFPNNDPNKRAVKTKRRKYGPTCVSDPGGRIRKLKNVSKASYKKRWEIRRRRYGEEHPYKISTEELIKRNPSVWKKGNIPWNKDLTKETDSRIDVWKRYTPKQKEERLLKVALGNKNKPNNLEKRVIQICEEYNFPFYFTGDKPYPDFNGWSPDFVSTDNSKKIIEVFGIYWHNRSEVKKRDIKRFQFYTKLGYEYLILWGDELRSSTDEKIATRIMDFVKNS